MKERKISTRLVRNGLIPAAPGLFAVYGMCGTTSLLFLPVVAWSEDYIEHAYIPVRDENQWERDGDSVLNAMVMSPVGASADRAEELAEFFEWEEGGVTFLGIGRHDDPPLVVRESEFIAHRSYYLAEHKKAEEKMLKE